MYQCKTLYLCYIGGLVVASVCISDSIWLSGNRGESRVVGTQ